MTFTARELLLASLEWVALARGHQYRPPWRPEDEARNWLVVGGRGSGKTRLGAEWVNALVRGFAPFARGRRHMRIALVGETFADVREVMVDGPSGIVAVARWSRPRYEPTRRRLLWDSGAVAQAFSSEDPESLRGPQFEAAWCDELAKWKNADACFDMLQFGLRLGEAPRQLVTTTPRPMPLFRRLLGDPGFAVTLTLLLRAQCGTGDAAASGISPGAPFVLLDEAVVKAGLAPEQAGLPLNWRIGPSGKDFAGPYFVDMQMAGGVRAQLPLPPVHLRCAAVDGGDLSLTWVRRGRIDADSWLGEDIPLGEESERYRIEIAPAGGTALRTAETPTPQWTYPAALQALDFPSRPAAAAFTVRQINPSAGAGLPARRTFTLI